MVDKENKIQGLTKKFLASWTHSSGRGQMDQIYVIILIKVDIHT
jgi:hypothetical protein